MSKRTADDIMILVGIVQTAIAVYAVFFKK